MAKADQVEKKRILVDGEDLEGLIAVEEYIIEDDVVQIPSRNKTVPVRNGVKKIPPIGASYKVNRNSRTLKVLQDWYNLKETHDVTLIRTDSGDNEFARELWTNVEVSKLSAPAYDAAAPSAATANITFLPEDIIDIAAEA